MADQRILSGKFIRLPAELKETLRAEFDKVRDQFENSHLGNFEKLFPLDLQADSSGKLAKQYATYLQHTKEVFEQRDNGLGIINARKRHQNANQNLNAVRRSPKKTRREPKQVPPSVTPIAENSTTLPYCSQEIVNRRQQSAEAEAGQRRASKLARMEELN